MVLKATQQLTSAIWAWLQRFSGSPLYFPLVGLLAALDFFVGFIPVDGVVLSAAMIKPKRWITIWTFSAIGSALGAVALAYLIQAYGESILVGFLHVDVSHSPTWAKISGYLAEFAVPTLALVAISPLPQQPAIVLCALAGNPLLSIFAGTLLGRIVRYGFICWGATHAPRLIARWKKAKPGSTEHPAP